MQRLSHRCPCLPQECSKDIISLLCPSLTLMEIEGLSSILFICTTRMHGDKLPDPPKEFQLLTPVSCRWGKGGAEHPWCGPLVG